MYHQYGISALISPMSLHRETSGSVTKFRLFSQAKREVEKNIGAVLGRGSRERLRLETD